MAETDATVIRNPTMPNIASIPVVLPLDAAHKNQCVDCVRRRLEGRPGIRRVEVGTEDGAQVLRLDYDPKLVTLAALEREVQNAKGCLDGNLAHLILRVDGMQSVEAERAIERALFGLPSVSVSASYSSGTVRLEFDRRKCPLPEIVRRLDKLGYRAIAPATSTDPLRLQRRHSPAGRLAEVWKKAHSYAELSLVIAGGLLLIAGFVTGLISHQPLDAWNVVRITLLVLSAICTSTETGPEAWSMLRRFKLDVDVLMFAAAIGASALGHYEEGALLLFLFGLGSAGEHLALARARSSIEALTKITPETATLLLEGGIQRQVGVKEVAEGDSVLVKPFERMPVDGVVIEGASAVDQSPVTGESIPVEKSIGSEVFAGTINAGGRLVVKCTKTAGHSTLARIIQLVEEAQSTKSKTQVFTDKVEHYYVPCVFIATTLLIFVPPLFHWRGWGISFYDAMAFLTAASPCALAIGTPAAVLCAIARAARIGVLIKGGVHLEGLGRVQAIAFDKTGTLTTGKLTVTDILPAPGHTSGDLLRLTAALESVSNHPLAVAIVAHARKQGLTVPEAADVDQIPAAGVKGMIEGRAMFAGKPSMMKSTPEFEATIAQLKSEGKALVALSIDGIAAGVIAMSDTPRAGINEAILALRGLGVRHCVMLTGDHGGSAKAVAALAGLDAFHADLLPEDKLRILGDVEKTYGPIAMIGDGVNDAPALAHASVGIAIAGAGSDVAMETADVVLLSDDIARLPQALALARKAKRIIGQNLVIALGVISIVAPLAALGFAKLSVAVLLHEGSTIVVVLNSLRLLKGNRPASSLPPNQERDGLQTHPAQATSK